MKYMLDTNICIYVIKHKPNMVIKRFLQHDPEEMCVSAVTYAELMHGVEKSMAVEKNHICHVPVSFADYNSGISCIGGGRVWESKGGAGEKRDADWPDGHVDSRTRQVRGGDSCNKQYKRVPAGGRLDCGRLDIGNYIKRQTLQDG